jgi:hypothetical protein
MRRFTFVVVLIAAVEAATGCPTGTTGPDSFTTFRLVPIQLRGADQLRDGSDCSGCCTCNQIAEFRFRDTQGNQIDPANVTNPGGNQLLWDNAGPGNLLDKKNTPTFIDVNIQPVVFVFSSGVSVTSYEWVTAVYGTASDMISWRLEGKQLATDAAWTTVHNVSNYKTTESRLTVVGPFNLCKCNPGPSDDGPCSTCPSGTYKDSYG